jgi:hypothetical protein
MDMKERDKQLAERWTERARQPFNGYVRPEDGGTRLPYRTPEAAEYAAFQLYEINQKLGQIIELLKDQKKQ